MENNAVNLTCKYCGIPARNQSQLDKHISRSHPITPLKAVDFNPFYEDIAKGFLTQSQFNQALGGMYMGPNLKQKLLSQVEDEIQHAYQLMRSTKTASELDSASSAFKNLIEAREMINIMEDN